MNPISHHSNLVINTNKVTLVALVKKKKKLHRLTKKNNYNYFSEPNIYYMPKKKNYVYILHTSWGKKNRSTLSSKIKIQADI